MGDVDPAEAVATAVKSARRAVTLALIAVVVSLIVLGIDHQIKQAIIDEAQKARAILDEFKSIVLEAAGDGQGTWQVAASGGDGAHPAGDVDDAPRTSAAPADNARRQTGAAGSRPRRPRGGTVGDGE
jgi:hypothetical protein